MNFLAQWFVFFYLYSFIGWVWECFYVSVRKRKWINRGFLNGPILPIYGFGAITILLVTMSVKENVYLVFIMGMLGATLLEYITGDLIEHIFHVRYWDYSKQPLNINGYICLGCSLGWGLFSVLLVNIVHKPIDELVKKVPEEIIGIVVVIITLIIIVDVVWSVNEALNLKEMILEEAEKSLKLQNMQKRMEEILILWNASTEKYREKTVYWKMELEEERDRLAKELAILKMDKKENDSKMRHVSQILKRNPGLQSPQHEKVLKNIRNLLDK